MMVVVALCSHSMEAFSSISHHQPHGGGSVVVVVTTTRGIWNHHHHHQYPLPHAQRQLPPFPTGTVLPMRSFSSSVAALRMSDDTMAVSTDDVNEPSTTPVSTTTGTITTTTTNNNNSFWSKLQAIVPPANERQKLIPLALMFFCILFSYTILRDTKDVLMITAPKSGAEVIPFIKTYVNLPVAIVRGHNIYIIDSLWVVML